MSRVRQSKFRHALCLVATLGALALCTPSPAAVIVGDAADAGVQYVPSTDILSIQDLNSQNAHIGNRFVNDVDRYRVVVYVFELAENRPDDFVVSSSSFLRFNLSGKDNVGSLSYNVDLRGLRWGASNTVLTSDYALGPTLLQSSIITSSTPNGLIQTSEEGSSKLASWLNAAYNQGATAGDYVFLQLTFDDTPTGGLINSYRVDLAGNNTEANRPILSLDFTPLPEPTTAAMVLMGAGSLLWLRGFRASELG